MLYIYNTYSKQKELFKPNHKLKVGLYVCGLTVYDDCHIGHGRLFIWFDVVVRYLRSIGFLVTYVRNITDIDDKIIKRAHELNTDYKILTNNIISSMHHDEKMLNILSPDFEPRVTDHIPQIIELIQILIEKGFAYTTKNDVYFDITKFKNYGKLAHQDLESLRSGIRIEINDNKKDPLDFVLWKAAKPQEPSWPSPWGEGRPGWHIECSAMAKKYLGENFDIHGGGNDLQFPHHQNELAQSEAANGCCFVNYWMHLGFVQVNHEKMSKSCGNFFTLKEILGKYNPEVLRYLVVASHYRSPINFSESNLENAYAALQRLYISIRGLPNTNSKNIDQTNQFNKQFHEAMNDDFNTPEALAVLFDLAHEINRLHNTNQSKKALQHGALLKHLCSVLGILQQNPEDFLKANSNASNIEILIIARNEARKNRDWAEADKIRKELTSIGIKLEDTPNGTTWFCEDNNQV